MAACSLPSQDCDCINRAADRMRLEVLDVLEYQSIDEDIGTNWTT
jgi:hypothetical protein